MLISEHAHFLGRGEGLKKRELGVWKIAESYNIGVNIEFVKR